MGNRSSRSSRRARALAARAEKAWEQNPPPTRKKVVLRVYFHCVNCSYTVRRKLCDVDGVEDVATDMENNLVTVTGAVEVADLVRHIYKKLRKHAEVIYKEEVAEGMVGEGGAFPAEEGGDCPAGGEDCPAASHMPLHGHGGSAFYYGYGAPPPPPPSYGHGFAGGCSYPPSPPSPPPYAVRGHYGNEYQQGSCMIM